MRGASTHIQLYRQTGNERYWKLAKFFLDERGKDDYQREGEYAIDRTYAQDHRCVAATQHAGVGNLLTIHPDARVAMTNVSRFIV